MKKSIIVILGIVAASFAFSEAQAQVSLRFGVKGGLNLSHSTITAYSANDSKSKENGLGPGFYVGGLAELSGPAGSKFKGQLEAYYSYQTLKYDDYTDRFSTISVPLMVRYFINPDFSVNAGASANFNIAGKAVDGDNELNYKDDVDVLNGFQPGVLAGVTYYINKGFFLDARYNYYFGNVLDIDAPVVKDPDYKLGTIQIGLGYKF